MGLVLATPDLSPATSRLDKAPGCGFIGHRRFGGKMMILSPGTTAFNDCESLSLFWSLCSAQDASGRYWKTS
jgi:hypothetical protein